MVSQNSADWKTHIEPGWHRSRRSWRSTHWAVWIRGVHRATFFRREDARIFIRVNRKDDYVDIP